MRSRWVNLSAPEYLLLSKPEADPAPAAWLCLLWYIAISPSVKCSSPPPFWLDEEGSADPDVFADDALAAAASLSLRVRKVVLVRSEAKEVMFLLRLEEFSSVLPKAGTEAARLDCSRENSVKPLGTRFGDRRETESVLRMDE